jgi:hypothetical protein
MQDEVNTKVVAIAIKGGRITAEVLKKALAKFIEEIEKAQKSKPLSPRPTGASSPSSTLSSRTPQSATLK